MDRLDKKQQRKIRAEQNFRTNGLKRQQKSFPFFHPTTVEYTFFLSAHGTFPKLDHILAQKTIVEMNQKYAMHVIRS